MQEVIEAANKRMAEKKAAMANEAAAAIETTGKPEGGEKTKQQDASGFWHVLGKTRKEEKKAEKADELTKEKIMSKL